MDGWLSGHHLPASSRRAAYDGLTRLKKVEEGEDAAVPPFEKSFLDWVGAPMRVVGGRD